MDHMAGDIIPTDKLTKLGNVSQHRQFRETILGLSLLSGERRAELVLN